MTPKLPPLSSFLSAQSAPTPIKTGGLPPLDQLVKEAEKRAAFLAHADQVGEFPTSVLACGKLPPLSSLTAKLPPLAPPPGETFKAVLEGRQRWTCALGDSLEVLKLLPDASVDAVVCDPPYMLGFMGKAFDDPKDNIAASVVFWREVLRVLKPGGHLLAFGGTRTYHRMVCAIEDAGFECRDSIHWIYGSGFPKSINVSKVLDKAADAERKVIGYNAARARPNRQYEAGAIGNIGGTGNVSDRSDNGATLTASATAAAAKRWDGWGAALKPSHEPISVARKPFAKVPCEDLREITGLDHWTSRRTLSTPKRMAPFAALGYAPIIGELPADDEADEGEDDAVEEGGNEEATAGPKVKPHFIIVTKRALHVGVRNLKVLQHAGGERLLEEKPFKRWSSATIAANVLKYGTGAINVDGCRIRHAGADDLAESLAKNPGRSDLVSSGVYGADRPQQRVNASGRWPANLVLSHSPECVRVGEKRVKPANGSGRASEKSGGFGGGMFGDSARTPDNVGGAYVDADGLETVADWICVEGCPIKVLDEQSGVRRSAYPGRPDLAQAYAGSAIAARGATYLQDKEAGVSYSDKGGCSRFFANFPGEDDPLAGVAPFFYTAKSSRGERERGCEALAPRTALETVAREPESAGVQSPRSGAGRGAGVPRYRCGKCGLHLGGGRAASECSTGAKHEPVLIGYGPAVANHHPTVKPLALMRWLCRLVTPPGGVCLDPFVGSGSTGAAALVEGFRFIGIEKEAEYLPIAEARLRHTEKETPK